MTNYNQKSTEGLSIAFLTTWMLGDIFNLLGCLMEPATLPTQFYMALVYTLATTVLYVQSIYYGYIYQWLENRRNHRMDLDEVPLLPEYEPPKRRFSTKPMLFVVSAVLFLGTFGLAILLTWSRINNQDLGAARKLFRKYDDGEIGLLLGWGMAAIYMGGRLPQIFLNKKRGHVEGLNPLMFFFALLGNITYVASILLKSVEWINIAPNLPWLVDAGGCVVLDFLILLQFYYFRDKDSDKKKLETGEEAV
ncbi:unnamed protein product [Microthlaspi erraticum]|uniref:Uncharacterized protein n=1 Tax=Microthlaspi erraticum TaxID=1685480 RepID=A0A6D2IKI1_9BRAS|nr:unnamed protein product [Microthlaspi erraticum]